MGDKQFTIGIIGGGVLGQAVASFFDKAKIYDKFKKFDVLDEVLGQDVIFVCVPTPYKNGFDRSYLDDVFLNFKNLNDTKIIVIKSTVIPGTTDYFQGKYKQHKVLFNPEFLTEKTAKEDFNNPDKQIVGFTSASKNVAEDILSILPKAPYQKTMPSKTSELLKYSINSFYANKVIFGNLLYDLCQSMDVDYNDLKEAFVSDKRIADSHFNVMHGGYRGYGGKCLPKDVKALIDFGNKQNVSATLLEAMDSLNNEYNKRLVK